MASALSIDPPETANEDVGYQNRFVAPDFKRRQLIFDSFTKLKQANAQNQRGVSTDVSGPKGRSLLMLL